MKNIREKVKRNINKINILSIIILVMLIIFLAFFFFYEKGEAGKCLMNPFKFGQEKLNFTCSCKDSQGNIYGDSLFPEIKIEDNSDFPYDKYN